MQTIENYDFSGKKALIRVDFNVPLNDNFEITDDTRMSAAVPTIKKVIEKGGSPIIMSHFGRPKGGPDPKYSLAPVAAAVAEVIGKPVAFASDCIGEPAETAAAAM